jgi:hypothetical protein
LPTLYARSEQGGRKAAVEADEPGLVLQTDFAAMGIDLDEARPGPAPARPVDATRKRAARGTRHAPCSARSYTTSAINGWMAAARARAH